MTSAPPHLLLVDDESDILDFLERVLRRQYRVTRCSSAVEAKKLLETQQFSAIISDQKMPQVTGLELLRHAKQRYPATARLLISGYTEMEDMTDAIETGILDHFVFKPVDSRSVLEAVAHVLTLRAEERIEP